VAGQIIIVSGTSGSGKSTTCELFAQRSEQFWLLYGIDHFLAATVPSKFGHHGPRAREGIYAHPVKDSEGPLRWSLGKHGEQAFRTFHAWIAAASREGCNIIVDHLMLIDPPILQDALWQMQDLPVLFVVLKPPYQVLEQRVATRKMGGKSNTRLDDEAVRRIRDRLDRLRPWFYEAAYANDCCDLQVDTVEHRPNEVCDLIEQRLAKGPGGAFDTLRARYPKTPSPPSVMSDS
jgi:chloramphenicol 3-O-phosphotransferase